jgi:hypothetical protein
VEVPAANLGVGEEALGVPAKQQDRGVGGLPRQEQVEMGHDVGERSAGGEGKLAFLPGAGDEGAHGPRIKGVHGGAEARLVLEGPVLNHPLRGEVIDQAGVDGGSEIRDTGEPPPN